MATRELWTKLVQVNDWINDTVKRTAGIELMPNSLVMCCSLLCVEAPMYCNICGN